MKTKLLLAALLAILGLASTVAWAGFAQRQLDNGAMCFNQSNVTASGDRLCFNAGTFNYFEICGDATTVNNNTVYYGPNETVVSSATVGMIKCDTTAAGSTTEATADAPVLTATAFYPLGMACYNPDNASGITYTLRTGAAAMSPSISVTLADNVLSGTAAASGTSLIASGATVAIAASSTGDIGTIPFICRVFYAS